MATSTDGISWTKYDDPGTTELPYKESDPVLTLGGTGEWDAISAFGARVLETPSGWEMFYTGTDGSGGRAIGYAWSADGIHWVKDAANPIFTPADDPYAANAVEYPTVLVHGPKYWMYYDYVLTNGVGLAIGKTHGPR
jgi:predicted GH43/DUF377 family glycosyl hydrolase